VKALPPLDLTFDGQPGANDLVILHHTPAWWIAEFRGTVAQRVKAIAGASTVVTGFNGHVPGSVVCKAIAMLNPNAEVMLARAEELPQAKKAIDEAPEVKQATDELFAVAADVVGYSRPRAGEALQVREEPRERQVREEPRERQVREEPRERQEQADIERARGIRRRLGTMAACSYLRDRGWSFEAAHQLLLQPRTASTASA
jgi:hypothetical protein